MIVLNGALDKTRYYAIRVEFQVRSSSHIHSFIWILNAPKLTKESKQEYNQWVNSIIWTDMLDLVSEAKLFKLVRTFQVHQHSKICRKYRNNKCRLHFGKFFTSSTIIAELLSNIISGEVKIQVLKKRNVLLSKVKRYIDTKLNSSKRNFYECLRNNYEKLKSTDEILGLLGISKVEYKAALSVCEDKNFQLHLKRPLNSYFVNNYFLDGLLSWEANLDIQPVFNHYKAVPYIVSTAISK